MVGLTLFAELAAAVACGGLALSLAELAGVRTTRTIAAVGGAAGFFIGFVTQMGLPMLALPFAILTVAGLDHWIRTQATTRDLTHLTSPARDHPMR